MHRGSSRVPTLATLKLHLALERARLSDKLTMIYSGQGDLHLERPTKSRDGLREMEERGEDEMEIVISGAFASRKEDLGQQKSNSDCSFSSCD